MKLVASISTLVAIVTAAADPQITPRAELAPRQNSDPAFLGWVSASTFSDARSCDFPFTLSRSGNLAQCCSSTNCQFWSSCSAGTLYASQTSLFCDQGFCNTAVLVPSVGASSGQSYLGCWATSLGQNAFTIVRDIGSASVGQATASGGASSRGSSAASSAASSARSVASSVGSATTAASSAAGSTGAGSAVAVQPLTGVVGLVAVVLGML